VSFKSISFGFVLVCCLVGDGERDGGVYMPDDRFDKIDVERLTILTLDGKI
jgi:hypothetical protein